MKIELEISEKNESTSDPYWLILDPVKMTSPSVNALSSMITGPFFSRDEAQCHMTNRSHNFGQHATVFCMSGYHSGQYHEKVSNVTSKLIQAGEM